MKQHAETHKHYPAGFFSQVLRPEAGERFTKTLVLAGLFLVFGSQLAGQAPPAPSEPAFLGPNGATVSLGGKAT
ncbi:MAG: hypothetical protein M5U25_06970 [Planctomycetota bacterium]|nr:hypothetical protein [Planctomycetota bacterium]